MSIKSQHADNKRLLTDALLSELTCQSKTGATEYSDTQIKGLKCAIYPTGKKTLLYRYRWKGRKRAVSLGHYPALSVSDARKQCLEIEQKLNSEILPNSNIPKTKELILNELFKDWYLPWALMNKKSVDKDIQRFRDHIQSKLGHWCVSDITPFHITEIQQHLMRKGYKPATNNRVITLLKAIFTWANRQGLITTHPAKYIQQLREDNRREVYLSEEEMRSVFEKASLDENKVAGCFIQLLLLTGLRKDELRLLTWEHVDSHKKTIWLETTKNGQGRLVYLNQMAMDVLAKLYFKRVNEWVFPSLICKGKPMSSPRKAFKRILNAAGLQAKKLCFHSCRHSVAALIVSHGGTLYDVQQQLGHRNLQSSARYAHIYPKRQVRTANKIELILGDNKEQPNEAPLFIEPHQA